MTDESDNLTNAKRHTLARIAGAAAWVAGVYCLVVIGVLAWDCVRLETLDALDAPPVNALRDKLAQQVNPPPASDALPSVPPPPNTAAQDSVRQEIRQLDLQVRAESSARRARIDAGRYFLFGGLIAWLLCVATVSAARQLPPMPPKVSPRDTVQASRHARGGWPTMTAVLITGVALAGTAAWLGRAWPAAPNWQPPAPIALPPPASDDEMAANWPRFHGYRGLGIAHDAKAAQTIPLDFDARSGRGILWKTPLPLPGYSSPVVWRDRVFLTGATDKVCEVICFDAAKGSLLWRREVKLPAAPRPDGATEPTEDTGYAASTCATDGRAVYAIFATGELAAFDFEGRRLWAKSLGYPQNPYGHASSLLTWRDLLIVQYDQGAETDNLSMLLALKSDTGDEAWRSPRKVAVSWTTPIVISAGGKDQLVTSAAPWTIAYDPDTGSQLWQASVLSGEVAPSPAFTADMVVVAQWNSKIAAIRPTGSGDVTDRLVWTASSDCLPKTASLLGYDGKVLMVDEGVVTCMDARDGQKLYEHTFDTTFNSSPVLAGGRIVLFDKDGVCHAIGVGDKYQELTGQGGKLHEGVWATPAIVGGRMYVRGDKHLFCIGTEQ